MADMAFDRGTVKMADTPDGPAPVESTGFVVVAVVATQDEARALKQAVRNMGHEVQYFVAPPRVL